MDGNRPWSSPAPKTPIIIIMGCSFPRVSLNLPKEAREPGERSVSVVCPLLAAGVSRGPLAGRLWRSLAGGGVRYLPRPCRAAPCVGQGLPVAAYQCTTCLSTTSGPVRSEAGKSVLLGVVVASVPAYRPVSQRRRPLGHGSPTPCTDHRPIPTGRRTVMCCTRPFR